ncbi:lysozyme inhibitor LprI family protein [Sphingomonas sp.]|uniref:lysozyme inhibitor LprI family protein n=1 Tax=Sphingomonas sp. TaxID=28214 RepID=UPI002FDA89C3
MIPFALTALLPAPIAPAAPVALQSAAGPSFPCASATTAMEKAICADPTLAAQDRAMAQLFAIAKQGAFGSGASNQLAAQRTALQGMRACAAPRATEPLAACLKDSYAVRNQELAIASLLAAPATALPVLRASDPAFAPILEAVQLWSEAPADANWSAPERARSRARIAALLKPYLTALQTNADQSFGNSILSDPGSDGIAVRTTDDLFRSERHFAAFLNVLGPYLDEPKLVGMPRDLPCAAIVRHPKLLAATGPVFGSTMDNFVFRNDCSDSLPPLPSLDALVKKLNAHWPECEGTIRFAIYSAFNSDVDRARLGSAPAAKAKPLPTRKGVTAADAMAAERELAAYYVANLHASPAAAATMARNALLPILGGAHACD